MSADDSDLRDHELRVEAFWNEKLESAVNALAQERAKVNDERFKRIEAENALKEERTRSERALADERSRHDATNKARLQAFAVTENTVIETLHKALADERKARAAAEARFAEQKQTPVVIEQKAQVPRAWHMEVVDRDRHGFVRTIRLEPK